MIKPYVGTSQGSLVSSILANIYLDKLDNFVLSMKTKIEDATKARQWVPRGENGKGVGKYTDE